MTKRIVLLQALASTVNDLKRLIHGSNTQANQRVAGQWSLADVVSHLIYVEKLYQARLQLVLQEENPLLRTIHPDESQHDLTKPLSLLYEEFTQLRAETNGFLEALPRAAWQYRAIHEAKGDTTLRFLVQQLVDHDTEHLNQFIQIQNARNEGKYHER